MKYNKLVRDRIPEIIASKGKEAVTHVAEVGEYETKLLEKLSEEVAEIQIDPSQEELADLLEVMRAVCDLKGYNFEKIESLRVKKAGDRGGFSKKIILDEVTE